jgi:anti-sigma regulatory factor (Ser/Thr protein kinase)
MPTAGPPGEQRHVISITSDTDVYTARSRMRSMATHAGFGRIAAGELTIVVSELAWNIVKHARQGAIELATGTDPERGVYVTIAARDTGPPFRDFTAALRDGHDDRGPLDPLSLWRRPGIGGGLGAVQRFTHELRHEPLPGGKCIHAVRYLHPAPKPAT